MRKALACTLALAAITAFIVPAMAATRSVKVSDNYYVRDGGVPTVTVKQGDTVRWRFVGRSAHTVTVKRGPEKFGSKPGTSGVYRKTLTKVGEYLIYCRIHGAKDQSMVLQVK
jgi:plastocyanin